MTNRMEVPVSEASECTPQGESPADKLHLGCGEDYRSGYHNVDYVAGVDPDEVADLNEHPWPWSDGAFEYIYASHVFEHLDDIEQALRECTRVLQPGGRVVVEVPIGVDARADPDHKHQWTWRTPLFLCGERHWDVDVGLDVVDRRVRLWSHKPPSWLGKLQSKHWAWKIDRYGAGVWCFSLPEMSGEFTVVFKKPRL